MHWIFIIQLPWIFFSITAAQFLCASRCSAWNDLWLLWLQNTSVVIINQIWKTIEQNIAIEDSNEDLSIYGIKVPNCEGWWGKQCCGRYLDKNCLFQIIVSWSKRKRTSNFLLQYIWRSKTIEKKVMVRLYIGVNIFRHTWSVLAALAALSDCISEWLNIMFEFEERYEFKALPDQETHDNETWHEFPNIKIQRPPTQRLPNCNVRAVLHSLQHFSPPPPAISYDRTTWFGL